MRSWFLRPVFIASVLMFSRLTLSATTAPVLMDLHEKYNDKGLAILSVHIDVVGNVDTSAKLDEKINGFRKSVWNGRDLPFPTALSASTNTSDNYDGITASQYGIHSYPTTILIDRQGNGG